MKPWLLRTREPSLGNIQLGKVVQVSGRWLYANNVSAEMHETEEFAVAPCVIEYLRENGIELIWYYSAPDHTTYTTTVADLLERGHLVARSKRRPPYYHLAVRYWRAQHGQWHTPRTDDVLFLEWLSPERPKPAAVQESFVLA